MKRQRGEQDQVWHQAVEDRWRRPAQQQCAGQAAHQAGHYQHQVAALGGTEFPPVSHRLPTVPGQMATVLVALAATESSPSQIRVGNDTSVPPPATELMAPATKGRRKGRSGMGEVQWEAQLAGYREARPPDRPRSAPQTAIQPEYSHFDARF